MECVEMQGSAVSSQERYFVTEQEEAAKIGEMVKRRRALRDSVTALEDELEKYAGSWRLLARLTEHVPPYDYRVESGKIEVLKLSMRMNPDQGNPEYDVQTDVPSTHFDIDLIKRLVTNLAESRASLASVQRKLKVLGVD
jgi:hypothetical protein